MTSLQKIKNFGLIVACALIINFGYVITNLYDVPRVITVIFIPCILVLCLGWILKNMKLTITMSLISIILAASLTYISLTTPSIFGIIEDIYYKNLFNYTVFLQVLQFTLVTGFFAILTALIAGLAFE